MKKNILIFGIGLLSLSVMATPLPSKKQIGMFLYSKTCVVLENSNVSASLYNEYVKEAVQKYWKATEFEFIDQQEFNNRRFNSKYSFLMLMKVAYDKDPAGVSYNYMSLVLGDTAKDLTNMPELCSIPLSYSTDNSIKYGYAIPSMVKFMQKHVVKLEKKRFWIWIEGLKYYNCSARFNDKLLLLNKDMLAPNANSPEKIKTVYPYQIQLLTGNDIKEKMAANPVNTLFNFHVGIVADAEVGKCFDMIFDAEGNLYYYNSRKVTNDNKDGFNLKDFKHIR